MNHWLIYAVVFVISNLIGNLNFAIILGKAFRNLDIRTQGSKNAGFTNAVRVFGNKIGWFVFLGDFLKGIFAILVCYIIVRLTGFNSILLYYAAGLGVILGHDFPIFFEFCGGKGLLTSFAVLLCLNPMLALAALAVWFIIVATTNYVALGSVLCSLFYLLMCAIGFIFFGLSVWVFIYTAIIIGLIVFRHIENIKRLINKTENKVDWFKKNKKSR